MKLMRIMATILVVTSAAGLMIGCQKTGDADAINKLIAADSVWFNANTKGDSTNNSPDVMADAIAILWWRGLQTHPAPVIAIDVVGDSAYVEWSRGNRGLVNIWADTSAAVGPWVLWQKPLKETAKINAIFMRTGAVSETDRGWVLKKISWATGQSDSVSTVRIDSVRIQSVTSYPNGFVVSDPLHTFYDTSNVVTFHTSESVTITLYTNVADGDAFIHSWVFILGYVRGPFVNLGGGVYQGTWNTQAIAFPRFAIFDLIKHSTLYSSDGAYDFNGWLLPYKLIP